VQRGIGAEHPLTRGVAPQRQHPLSVGTFPVKEVHVSVRMRICCSHWDVRLDHEPV
jgi:hypothetical protein